MLKLKWIHLSCRCLWSNKLQKIYNIVLVLLSLVLSPVVLLAFLIKPKLRAGFWQKIGFYKKYQSKNESIWFHAVSVGEVNAIESLVKEAKIQFPDFNIVVTTVTKTGQNVAITKLKKYADIITYFPYDFDFSVKSAIEALNPKLVIIAETEIWPAFTTEVRKQNIPLILANGRISPSSYKGYKKFRFFFKRILANFDLILMQTKEDMERIIEIGANQDITQVMGNLKFDITTVLDSNEIDKLKQTFHIENQKLLIAASTHKGEDEIVIDCYKKLKTEFNDLKLILAPRHPERNNDVLSLICATGMKFGLRSHDASFENADIILLDTMGELSKLYSIADIAFMGGSFSNTGGHNPLEPAIYGVPVVSGPIVFNFKEIYQFMTKTSAAVFAKNNFELHMKIRELLTAKNAYDEASKACLDMFSQNKGALEFAINKMRNVLK